MTERIEIKSLEEIESSAREFLRIVGDHRVIAFHGSMGAGKTTFIKALGKIIGVTDIVNSPTFTIVNEYATQAGEPVYHFDLYRLEKIEDLYNIGFEEYLDSGYYCLIEWPQMAEKLLSENALKVNIEETEGGTRCLIVNNYQL